jgi:hypothetical protein
MAKAHWGSLGTWESRGSLMDHKPEMGETGQQHPGAPTADFPVGASEPSEVNHKAARPNAENTEGRAEKTTAVVAAA